MAHFNRDENRATGFSQHERGQAVFNPLNQRIRHKPEPWFCSFLAVCLEPVTDPLQASVPFLSQEDDSRGHSVGCRGGGVPHPGSKKPAIVSIVPAVIAGGHRARPAPRSRPHHRGAFVIFSISHLEDAGAVSFPASSLRLPVPTAKALENPPLCRQRAGKRGSRGTQRIWGNP